MAMSSSAAASEHSRRAWTTCLSSAFRATLACTIVAGATLYSPSPFQRQVALPAFSYVTVVLIVMDATLGDMWRSCWLALYATAQSVGPAILSLWLIGGPARLSKATTSIAVAMAAFVVVLPERTHLVAKRIALGQIVLIYVVGFIDKEHADAIMHPVHVAASTAVGLLACVLALLLPIPRLATNEVKESCEQYVENASNRLKLFVKAFSAEDANSSLSSISQAKCLSHSANKLIHSTKRYQESVQWEQIPFIKSSNSHQGNPGDGLQKVETHLRGMEIALTSSSHSFPIKLPNQELENGLIALEKQVNLWSNSNSSTAPAESIAEQKTSNNKSIHVLHEVSTSLRELSSAFFMFCLKSLAKPFDPVQNQTLTSTKESPDSGKQNTGNWLTTFRAPKRLMPALKCSLSLGLATMLGLMYSRENGFWAGLPVAISLASAREATFKVANVKAQGTVLGTVYGVVGCFLFERFLIVRFFSLIPWFIFTNFLRSSRMYGQAGGISAIIGAVLILGRKDFGPPTEFAIARIVETFIGLSCAVAVEVVLSPVRASTLARRHLGKTLVALHECIGSCDLRQGGGAVLEKGLRKLKGHVNGLSKCIGEADVEPNFWYMPFHSACYSKLSRSLSKSVDLLHFGSNALRTLSEKLEDHAASWKDINDELDADLKLFKDLTNSSIKCLEEVVSVKSLELLDKKLEENNNDSKVSCDLELGKTSTTPKLLSALDEDEIEKVVCSYLQHAQEVVDKIFGVEGQDLDNEAKSEVVLSLSAFGYFMLSVMRETVEIENMIREFIQWENPSNDINLHEIACKVQALYS
ncbi:uncharacterized protein LOC116199323 [Punica granatum]|uniref:Uncharacterized protein LOC116199323 n=1 Tax=Punica granatum TaxID=22663 RepID=A0A6P8CML2_PUNGR|nr:uncharacterized protein LOC116199323 [Punica granatum]